MNKLTRNVLIEIDYLKNHIYEIDDLNKYCSKHITMLEYDNENYDADDYDFRYNVAVISLLEGVKCCWSQLKSLDDCVSYLEDIERWINEGEFEYK